LKVRFQQELSLSIQYGMVEMEIKLKIKAGLLDEGTRWLNLTHHNHFKRGGLRRNASGGRAINYN
jgi:hypothetical protein